MLAFVRGESIVGGPGQIYVKLLPDGEPLQLTHNGPNITVSRPQFSLDGARIAYGMMENWTLDTWVVPVLGGQPRLFLANSMGLTWIEAEAGQPRIMYSELTGKGAQMGIFTSTESRAQQRTIYMPRAEDAGMAHFSHLSPDRKWILLAEMDTSSWLPCRLTPFDGSSPGKPVGPAPAQCTDAAWSPDGKWMYFTANAGNGYHIWRQSFPDGRPQQVTAGATQEEGIAFAPDGHSFVTAIHVQPGSAGRREVNVKAWVTGKPSLNFGMFVRSVVVHDQMQFLVLGSGVVEQPQELQPFLVPVPLLADTNDRPIQGVQGGKQCGGTVALVIVGHRLPA